MEIALIFKMHAPNSSKIYRSPLNFPVAKARWIFTAAPANLARKYFSAFGGAAFFCFP